ncbi:hypothetical protein C8Q79DRAFT_952664 [Trametes meyenii]|nr:hypothetical protein C8Q79DRAFT_952664 [Trametes meyenii]
MSQGSGNPRGDTSPHTHPNYYKSPLCTLVVSLDDNTGDISICDLIDAYSTFSLRVKACAAFINGDGQEVPSLQFLKKNSTALGHCIQRDIRRALRDPSLALNPLPKFRTVASPSIPLAGISEAFLSLARTESTLCQYALQLLSNIFAFPTLCHLFPQSVLEKLLGDTLLIAQSSELPILDSDKIRSLAAWIFSTSRLPISVVAPRKESIQGWLKELILSPNTRLQWCDIIQHALSAYPELFLPSLSPYLPDILAQLVSTNSAFRVDAAVALCGYARGMLSLANSSKEAINVDVLPAVRDFIRSQLRRGQRGATELADSSLSVYILRSAQEDMSTPSGQGARWAIVIICCLIILSGPHIFTGTRPFQLIIETLPLVAKHDSPAAIELVVCAWKCLIWAFLQIQPDETIPQATVGDHLASAPFGPRRAAFDLVKQELRGGAGACLVAGLLCHKYNHPPGETHATHPELAWAISILMDMATHHHSSVYRDGLGLLGRLVNNIGKPTDESTNLAEHTTWDANDVIVTALLSRQVFTSDAKKLFSTLHTANRFDAMVVRPLSEAEIEGHWDQLVEIWRRCIKRELQEADATFALPEVLLETWQALLLVQTQLTQEQGHLTATPEFTISAVSIVAKFLQHEPPSISVGRSAFLQQHTLELCFRLWTVMRYVFAETWLSAAAESLLKSVLRRTFDLSNEHVKAAWSELCSSLISASAPVLVARLVSEDEDHRRVDIRRELWRVATHQWPSMVRTSRWHDSADFLVLPLRYWSMDEMEISLWTAAIDVVCARAKDVSDSPADVLDVLMQHATEPVACARFLEHPTIALHLLSCLQLADGIRRPTAFLVCIDSFLSDLYSDLPERVSTALLALPRVRQILCDCPPSSLTDVLTILSGSLALWIGDERELLLRSEYNEVVVPLYCDVLERLQHVTITSEILSALAHFLYSAFIRIPDPGLGPIAFYDFWMHVQPSLKHLRGAYPDDIKTALHACHEVFGDMSSQDLSFDTDSHSDAHTDRQSDAEMSPVKSEPLTPKSVLVVRDRLLESRKTTPNTSSPQRLPQAVSQEVPYYPTLPLPVSGTRQGRPLRFPSSGSPSKRARPTDASSDFMPSSPTDAVQARRLAARPVSRVAHQRTARSTERPLKRQKVEGSPRTPRPGSAASPTRSGSASHRKKGPTSASRTPRGSSSTPREKGKGKQVSTPRSSPTKAAPTVAPSPDDYDAWEAPLREEDVPKMTGFDETSIIPSSQPSNSEEDDDPFVPSFMRTSGRRGRDTQGFPRSDDTMMIDDDDDAAPLPTTTSRGKRPRPDSPPRVQTAPASLQHSQASLPELPLARARTASAHLEELRNVYGALSEDGSQLSVGEIAAASELTHKLGAMLGAKLSRKLRGGKGDGSSEGKGKGKGKEKERE